MDLINRGNTELTRRKKKKRSGEHKNLFSIYKSEKTLKDYMFYLNKFLNYVYEGEGTIKGDEIVQLMGEITKEDIEDYIYHLVEEKEMKMSSVNKIISSLKSLYRELEKNGFENPMKFIPLLKVTRHNFDNVLKVSAGDIQEILDKYEVVDDKTYRSRMILYTLFYTGMRSQELLDMKYSSIIRREGEYVIKIEKTKSGREQYKPLHNACVEKLKGYRSYMESLYSMKEDEMEDSYVFPGTGSTDRKLSYSALYNIVQDMGKLIDKDISPHNIRHAVATELSLNGADIVEIRDFLGHADTKVTEIYINAKSILEKRALEKLPELR